MQPFPPTIILRHRRENLKKCSLRGLETREDIDFYTYPWKVPQPDLSNYIVLSLNAPPLTKKDAEKGIFLIDGTWRYATKMFESLEPPFETRSLPPEFRTAYPRRQDDCIDPDRGLASIEALYLTYSILERGVEGLLNHYRWGDEFINVNSLPKSECAREVLTSQDGFLRN